ncbi:MAG: hypothetical protein KC441_00595 [Anaerolineales bacterium]|nr:hypothetical protein [Anaerolineales bacterium]
MAIQITAQSVAVHPYADGVHEIVLTETSANVDFSLLTDKRFGLSELTSRVFFCDLDGRLWLVTTESYQTHQHTFEEGLCAGDRRRPELMAERRVFSPAQAAALFS